jgi:hypothetical protein
MTPRGWFYRIRVTALASILIIVALYAYNDHRRRSARTTWREPLRVGLILLRAGNVNEDALRAVPTRTSTLEQRLTAEHDRYRPSNGTPMIQFVVYGPVDVAEPPPSVTGESFLERARHAFTLWQYTRGVDGEAGVPSRGLGSRIYLVARPKASDAIAFVEGFSQSGGHIGVANVELAEDTVDLALFVATHELFHTLGATDKYDSLGRTLVPDGLAAPDQTPLFPQPGADVMARNRVFDPTLELPPESLDELWVGPATAREIGWRR